MSHFHRYYSLGPYDKSVSVVFQYLGPNSATLHFVKTEDLPLSVLGSESNSLFKAPAGYRFTVEVCEVAIGPGNGNGGRFHLNFELHPSTEVAAMGEALSSRTAVLDTELPPGECVGSGACAGSGSISCQIGQTPHCDEETGVLECVDFEPPKA